MTDTSHYASLPTSHSPKSHALTLMHLERLESRIAPAALAGGKLTYTDVDNDLVTITFSKKTGLDENDFVFDTAFATTGPQRLLSIELSDDAPLKGTNITMKVTKVGDGKVHIGAIAASGLDLGAIKLLGDLRKIDAGTGQGTAVKSLSVQSWGNNIAGLTITPGSSIPADLVSTLNGKFGSIAIAGDFAHANLRVFDVSGKATNTSFTVGGKLLGGEGASEGLLQLGSVKTIKLGGIVGGVLASPATLGAFGGVLQADNVGTLTITGDIHGGNFSRSGSVEINGTLGKATLGKIIGGHGEKAGFVTVGGAVGTMSVGGLVGGNLNGPSDFVAGGRSGALNLSTATSLTVREGITGGSISASGQIFVAGAVKKLTLTGDVQGADGVESGSVRVEGKVTTLKVTGSVLGGTKNGTGNLNFVEVTTATVIGDFKGSDLAPTDLGGSFGATGAFTAFKVGTFKLTGSIFGGMGREEAGGIHLEVTKNFTMTGSLNGGALEQSGSMDLGELSGTVLIKGEIKGGLGDDTGQLTFEGGKKVTVTGIVEGGDGASSGMLFANDAIGSVTLGGLKAGTGNLSGSLINLSGSFKTVVVTGDILGLATNPANLSAVTGPGGVALGSVTVKGNVTFGQITAGFAGTTSITADPGIGKVTIGKDFTSSSIVAGVDPVNGFFGDGDDKYIVGGNDPAIIARIGAVVIKGTVLGTAAPTTDSFGIVAEEIGKVTVGKTVIALTPGPSNDLSDTLIGGTTDVRVRELAPVP
jgi:hypothetical protein